MLSVRRVSWRVSGLGVGNAKKKVKRENEGEEKGYFDVISWVKVSCPHPHGPFKGLIIIMAS